MEELDATQLDAVASLQAAVTSNLTWREGAQLELPPQIQLVLEIVMVLMCLGAVAGNILVVAIVAANKTLHCLPSVLIINLAISDLLVGIGVMPFVAMSVMNCGWAHCSDLCLYVGYTSSVYCTASVLTLAAIALDRYHSIMDCLRYNSRCTLFRTCIVVLWIWLQALVTSSPPLLGWSSIRYVQPMFICAINWVSSPSYAASIAALSYFTPAVVILFCYVKIVKVARSHARRIQTLEVPVQRSRNLSSVLPLGDSSPPHFGSQYSPSTLIYHVTGQFISEVNKEGNPVESEVPEQPTCNTTARRLFFQAQNTSQQLHNHQGLVRLFLVICAFFLCWTPYVGLTLVQATETAITGESNLVPHTAVTFSYWLLLLNSDINPLLYALLSQRFQTALCTLKEKIRTRVRCVLGRREEVKAGDTPHPGASSTSEYDVSPYASSVFTVSTDYTHSEEHLCKVCHLQNTSSICSLCQNSGEVKEDRLQVPSRPQEGSRLPFSALTTGGQTTFFYGQITVRLEHDVC
ncbi:5-hydroxytryptamine receptor 1D [Thalassophryne amazonica]|uniref:5-hydroxytryptamine receptor 1D n=1 Tax=Thalassophryne amazonica TaxID=390379 RepID=UPI0014712995|nr:5-hydroxytryptamine receptor 1D [Thalassophryne amazonica]